MNPAKKTYGVQSSLTPSFPLSLSYFSVCDR
jgi:hypothetical protein